MALSLYIFPKFEQCVRHRDSALCAENAYRGEGPHAALGGSDDVAGTMFLFPRGGRHLF